ncbi:Hypothetical predicted protein [Lecanosticta acicola]|uniref:Integrase zinc-binding domain-containing protein n=1 Tax=Lecanosticta acicola TaxID=111012 RepID=A0AAI8Z5Q2_9PEZI|nr:Hypothetical predicted protein [Lecanosticta acicola]
MGSGLLSSEVAPLLQRVHNEQGHFSFKIVQDKLRSKVYWPFIASDIRVSGLHLEAQDDKIINLVNTVTALFETTLRGNKTAPTHQDDQEPMACAAAIIMDCKALELTCLFQKGDWASITSYIDTIAGRDIAR